MPSQIVWAKLPTGNPGQKRKPRKPRIGLIHRMLSLQCVDCPKIFEAKHPAAKRCEPCRIKHRNVTRLAAYHARKSGKRDGFPAKPCNICDESFIPSYPSQRLCEPCRLFSKGRLHTIAYPMDAPFTVVTIQDAEFDKRVMEADESGALECKAPVDFTLDKAHATASPACKQSSTGRDSGKHPRMEA